MKIQTIKYNTYAFVSIYKVLKYCKKKLLIWINVIWVGLLHIYFTIYN